MEDLFSNLIIFEMANNHQGFIDHGIAIIEEMAKICRKYNVKGAVKLQYRNLDSFIHPNYKGSTEDKHISRFESTRLRKEEFDILVEKIREESMLPMSTPFDEDGVDWCISQGLPIIKVASCSSMDWPLMEKLAETRKPLIVSTGGKSVSDIDKIYNFLIHRNCKFSFMHCIAEYPVPEERVQLDFIERMKKRYRGIVIGYSGHEDPNDNLIPMMAVAKGAQMFERHVGLPTDEIKLNKYSMDPEQTERWVEALVRAKTICTLKSNDESKYISQEEVKSLQTLMRGVYAKTEIKEGEHLSLANVYFAIPFKPENKQMSSSEFSEDVIASRDYSVNEPVFEQRTITDINIARSAIHDVKGLLFEASIALGREYEVELSHHYGMGKFRNIGATIISIINREYCKKLLVVLPGQSHPSHYHKVKEETFQVLYGDLECVIEGKIVEMKAGDIITVLRGQMHSFSSREGAVFEEISTTHLKGDSYYEDEKIDKQDLIKRKTIIKEW